MNETESVEGLTARRIPIFIDAHEYESATERVTEAELRALPRPPTPEDREVWLDIVDELDRPLREDEIIDLHPGMRFFTETRKITIFIDRVPFVVEKKRVTGLELRAVPTPPVAEDRDLWLDIVDKKDEKIRDDQVVRLREDMRFFTAPGRINPGSR